MNGLDNGILCLLAGGKAPVGKEGKKPLDIAEGNPRIGPREMQGESSARLKSSHNAKGCLSLA